MTEQEILGFDPKQLVFDSEGLVISPEMFGIDECYNPFLEEFVKNIENRKVITSYEWLFLDKNEREKLMRYVRYLVGKDYPKMLSWRSEGNIDNRFVEPTFDGYYSLSFDRTGRRDGLETEILSATIIEKVIKRLFNIDIEAHFYSWKGTVDHIEIEQQDKPTIIFMIDDCTDSTNRELCTIANIISYLNTKLNDYVYNSENKDKDLIYGFEGNYEYSEDKCNRIYDRHGRLSYE